MCQSYVTSVSGFLAYLYVCIFYNVENCDLREDMCCNSILSFCIPPWLITRKINKLSSFKTFKSVLSAFELYNFYWNYMFMYNASHVIAIWQGMSKSVFMSLIFWVHARLMNYNGPYQNLSGLLYGYKMSTV